MRPNLFANTPDILHEYLQYGGRPAFMTRLVLAATLGATYGIYGPPFELCVGQAVRHGSEEYLDSEKYQVRHWDLDSPGQPPRLRHPGQRDPPREPGAPRQPRRSGSSTTDNDQVICYGKATPDLSNIIVVVVNLDPYHTQSAWVRLPTEELGLGVGPGRGLPGPRPDQRRPVPLARRVELRPARPVRLPAHIFRVRRKVKTERDFDYYM